MEGLTEAPVRLCCGQRHYGVVCPDDLVMCAVCFNRFNMDELFTDSTGDTWDICQDCGEQIE
jgi:hypothetical protein